MPFQHLVEQAHAFFQRFAVAAFFRAQGFHNLCLFLFQLRIRGAHFFHQIGHEFVEKRLILPEFVTVAHGQAHDAAQDVTAAFVARQDTINNQEEAGADVVGDDFQPGLRDAIKAGRFCRGGKQVAEQVDFVVGVDALHDGGDALWPHAGVDGGAQGSGFIVAVVRRGRTA